MTVLLVVIVAMMLIGLGLVLWPHRFKGTEAQVAFGTSIATGAAISLAFFVLQNENQTNQDRLTREQTVRLSIALQTSLAHADLRDADLREINLAGKDLSGADLRGVALNRADLTKTNLSGARLEGAHLKGANLTDANLTGARLTGIDLRGAELRRANLNGAIAGGGSPSAPPDRSASALVEARRAILRHLRPERPSPPHADFRGASLRDAHLSASCLAHADLRGARLGGADLRNAVLTGADLRGSHFDDDGVFANLEHVAGLRLARVDGRDLVHPRAETGVPVSPPAPRAAHSDSIARVSDGDTFLLASGRWARLVGINAWAENDPQGRRATNFLRYLSRRSPGIRYTLGNPADESFRDRVNPPGRLRVFVWLGDGRFLNQVLLAQGYVERQYPGRRHREDPDEGGYQSVFNAARDQARDSGRGVWSTCRTT